MTSSLASTTTRLLGLFRRSGGAPSRPSRAPGKREGRSWGRRIALGFAWFLFSSLCFLSFFYLTFPYDRVRDYVVHRIEVALPGSEVEIVRLEPAWLTGIEASGVRIRLSADPAPAPAPHSSEPPRRPARPSLTIPHLYARLGILGLLTGARDVTFDVETDGGGRVEGYVEDDGRSTRVVAHLDAVDLRRLTIVHHFAGVAFAGELSGELDVQIAEDEASSDGRVDLSLTDASIGDESFEVPLPIPGMSSLRLTRLNLGHVVVGIGLEDGTARLERFSEDGGDLALRVTGTARVRRALRATTFDLLVRAGLEAPYLERNPALQSAVELAGASPLVAPYRTSDGAFQVRVQGSASGHVTTIAAGSVAMGE